MNGFLSFLSEHPAHVAPLLLTGVVGIAITLERYRALCWVYPLHGQHGFFAKIKELILSDRIPDAIVLCDRYRSKLGAQVVKEALIQAHQPESLIENGLQISVSEQIQKIQRRTGFLSTIANIATLLGLLGTILGLIQSFEAVSGVSAQQRSALLSAGISTAMNSTMLGLGVAIPCLVAYSFLASRSNRLSAEVEQAAIRSLHFLKQRFYAAGEELSRKRA